MKTIKKYLILNIFILLVLNNLFGIIIANKYMNLNRIVSPLIILKENKYGNNEGIYLTPTLIFSKKLNIKLQETFQKGYFYSSVIFLLLILYRKKELTTHGSAKFASNGEIKEFNLLANDDGVVLGMTPNNKIMTQNGSEHIMAMAPTRSGKGINTVLPTLWTWKHSVIINDIKGECWDLTSGFRRSVLGHKCIYFNPVDDSGEGISYNPLSLIGIGQSREGEDIKTIATTLLDINDKADDSHWIAGAINLFIAVVTHVMYVNPKSSFIDIINFMEDPAEPLIDKIKKILGKDIDKNGNIVNSSVHRPFDHYNELKKQGVNNRDFIDLYGNSTHNGIHPTVGSTFSTILSTPDKERGSIISTCVTRLNIFKDPRIRKNIQRSDITPKEIMNNKVALYLITPPKAIKMTRPLFRLIITQCIYELTDKMEFENRKKIDEETNLFIRNYKKVRYIFRLVKKKKIFQLVNFKDQIKDKLISLFVKEYEPVKKNKRILFLIDEFPALGNLALLETALAFIAGYGLKVLMITQSINQLRKIYGKDNSIIDNCHTQLYFTPNDDETPKMISTMLGKKTLKITTKSGRGFSMESRSESYISRELMTPAEIRTLKFEEIILFVSGKNPIRGKKIFWFKHKKYKNNANYNIPYRSYVELCNEIEVQYGEFAVKYLDEYILEYLIFLKQSYKSLKLTVQMIGAKEFIKKIMYIDNLEKELLDLKQFSTEKMQNYKIGIVNSLIKKKKDETIEEFEETKRMYLEDITMDDLILYIQKKHYLKLSKENIENLIKLNLERIEKPLEKIQKFKEDLLEFLLVNGVRESLVPPIPEYFVDEINIVREAHQDDSEIFGYMAVHFMKDKESINYDSILKSVKSKYYGCENKNNIKTEGFI